MIRVAFFGCIAFVILMMLLFRKQLDKRVEVFVFMTIVTLGGFYSFCAPASLGESWDDETHFYWTAKLAHTIDADWYDAEQEMLKKQYTTAMFHDVYTKDTCSKWEKHIDEMYKSGAKDDNSPRVRLKLNRVAYIPMALGYWIGLLFKLPYHLIFELGRFMNVLMYAMLVYFAIKRLQSGKMLMASVAMLPQMMLMASSYSYDPWLVGWTLLGFGIFFGEIQNPDFKLENKDIVLMFASIIIGTMVKAIYVILILVFLFMPKEKFKSESQRMGYYLGIAVLLLLGLASFLLPFFMPALTGSGSTGGGDSRGTGVNTGEQIKYMFSNPFEFTKTLLYFLKHYFTKEPKIQLTNTCWISANPSTEHTPLVVGTLLLTMFTDRYKAAEENINWWHRASVLVLSFGCVVLCAVSMFIAFTPVGKLWIDGCQYRYMYPIFFPTLFILGGLRINNPIPRKVYNAVILIVLTSIVMYGYWVTFVATF